MGEAGRGIFLPLVRSWVGTGVQGKGKVELGAQPLKTQQEPDFSPRASRPAEYLLLSLAIDATAATINSPCLPWSSLCPLAGLVVCSALALSLFPPPFSLPWPCAGSPSPAPLALPSPSPSPTVLTPLAVSSLSIPHSNVFSWGCLGGSFG